MIFARSLALAAFLAPLASAAQPPPAEQPRFTVALDDWRISYRDGPGKVGLGISITLQGKGTFVIPSSGEGQLTRLVMQDSTGSPISGLHTAHRVMAPAGRRAAAIRKGGHPSAAIRQHWESIRPWREQNRYPPFTDHIRTGSPHPPPGPRLFPQISSRLSAGGSRRER